MCAQAHAFFVVFHSATHFTIYFSGDVTALIERHLHGFQQTYGRCRQEMFENQSTDIGDSIRLMKLSGTFAVWMSGAAIAVIAFVTEMICFCRRNRRALKLYIE